MDWFVELLRALNIGGTIAIAGAVVYLTRWLRPILVEYLAMQRAVAAKLGVTAADIDAQRVAEDKIVPLVPNPDTLVNVVTEILQKHQPPG